MRVSFTSVVVALAAWLVLVGPAAAAGPDPSPVRLWSVSKVEQGAGEVPVSDGAQVGGGLQERSRSAGWCSTSRCTRRTGTCCRATRAFGASSRAPTATQYSVLAQAPTPNPRRRSGAPKGTVTHLDEYQAYVKRAGDASLRITLSDLLLQTIDDNNQPRGLGVPGRRRLRAGAHRRALPRPRVRGVGGR